MSLDLTEGVWGQSTHNYTGVQLSANVYNFLIGMTLLWGFGMNYIMIQTIPGEVVSAINPWVLLIGYFVCCIAGIALFTASDNPILSFIGYNMVVVPIGIIIIPFVQSYDSGIVQRAVMTTGLVTTIMMILGTMFPAFFAKIERALFTALIIAIVVELFMIFTIGHSTTWMDWVVVIIFCGYIGVDWGRAQHIPRTVDNAVDSAAALYIDIINLFIRLLSIMGGSDD